MSAMIGIGEAATICASTAASSSRGTARRTMSAPASATVLIWSIVAVTLEVSVFVIVCTATGAPPPIGTPPTMIWRSEATIRFYGAGPARQPWTRMRTRYAYVEATSRPRTAIARPTRRLDELQRFTRSMFAPPQLLRVAALAAGEVADVVREAREDEEDQEDEADGAELPHRLGRDARAT